MVPKVLVAVPTAEMARTAMFYDTLRCIVQPPHGIASSHGQSPARNRNSLIEQALQFEHPDGSKFSHILFIDDDVLPPNDVIDRLLNHDVDMVSGLYLMRSFPHQPIAFDWMDSSGHARHFYPEHGQNGLVEISSGGLGCCLIKREVFEAMIPYCEVMEKDNCHNWIRLGEMVSDHWCDDLGFFMRARDLGFQLYLDLSVKCGHINTYVLRPEMSSEGVHIVKYDTGGTQSIAFPLPTLSELKAATSGAKNS